MVATASAESTQRLEDARAVNVRLRQLLTERRRNLAAIARELAIMRRGRLYALLGYANLAAYARAELGMGKSKVSELVGIVEGAGRLPAIGEAFAAGKLEWTKARELVKLATPETETAWLLSARGMTGEELRAVRTGEAPTHSRSFSLSEEESAEFDQLLAWYRDQLGALPNGQLLLEVLRRGAKGVNSEARVPRVVFTQCPDCQRATIESREGPLPVDAATVEAALCDGEVHDLREEDNQVTRAIPAKVRRRVLDRDRNRCQVPGCRSMSGLELHHEDGWRAGHDPERIVTLCGQHHRIRHEGQLRIEALGGGRFRFRQLDGAVLGEAFSHENVGTDGSVAEAQPKFSHENPGGTRRLEESCPPQAEPASDCPGEFDDVSGLVSWEPNGSIAEVGPEFSHENGSGAFARDFYQSLSAESLHESAVHDAITGLASLGLSRSEAKRRVENALAVGVRGTEGLLRAALLARSG